MIWAVVAALAATQTQPCRPPLQVERIASSPARYVVLGETHGTVQAPAALAEIACALAERKERLLVAVELSAWNDDALQKAWRGSTSEFARDLRAIPEWSERTDGVASRAMFEMLVRLHALKSAGRPIDIVAFNGERDADQMARFASLPGQGPHEAAQADNIARATSASRHDRVLVLVGDLHARKKPAEGRSVSFEPMARRLAPAADVLSLRAVYAAGTAWNCQLKSGFKPLPGQPVSSEAIECGAYPTPGYPSLSGPARILSPAELGEASDPAYDAQLWLGPVSASPPDVAGPTGARR